MRTNASVNACLILRQDNNVLLMLRQNTGFLDGRYGVVSGHVEDGESALSAIIREAKEEVGITLQPHHVHFVHCIHHRTERFNVDIFFEANEWEGEIKNIEPHKCGNVAFFPKTNLPENTADHIVDVLKFCDDKQYYSERGWATATV